LIETIDQLHSIVVVIKSVDLFEDDKTGRPLKVFGSAHNLGNGYRGISGIKGIEFISIEFKLVAFGLQTATSLAEDAELEVALVLRDRSACAIDAGTRFIEGAYGVAIIPVGLEFLRKVHPAGLVKGASHNRFSFEHELTYFRHDAKGYKFVRAVAVVVSVDVAVAVAVAVAAAVAAAAAVVVAVVVVVAVAAFFFGSSSSRNSRVVVIVRVLVIVVVVMVVVVGRS